MTGANFLSFFFFEEAKELIFFGMAELGQDFLCSNHPSLKLQTYSANLAQVGLGSSEKALSSNSHIADAKKTELSKSWQICIGFASPGIEILL